MPLEIVTPSELAPPRGYSHGVKGRGRLSCVAGPIAWDAQQRVVSDDCAAQFGQALDNVLAVVRAAGGAPSAIVRLTLYVTDRTEYRARARDVGVIYRSRMGRH